MPNLFSDQQLDAISDLYDDMFDTFSKECLLVYEPKKVACSDCVTPANGSFHAGTGRDGGPIFIPNFACPECGGTKIKKVDQTETIRLECDWEPYLNKKLGLTAAVTTEMPYGILITKGYLVNAVKVKRAVSLKVQIPDSPFVPAEYKLSAVPVDQFKIVQSKFFLAVWERIN